MMMLRLLLLCVVGCSSVSALSRSLRDGQDAHEVTLKVHLSDATTHQPLGGAAVELFANHTSVTAETSAADGNAYLRFPYRLGMPLVVTATRQGYVPNSAPWSPNRLPVFSSLSLDLLPERAATLMVYDNVVQILSGFQGSRGQAWVEFERRSLILPPDTSYSNLTALLTVASSPAGLQHFPYLLGLPGNGSDKWFELTPVAAISVHLLAGEGAELQVNRPIKFSVPLPADSGLKENDHIPAWRFDPRLGVWLQSALGTVSREGQHLRVKYRATQLGYWVLAMSPLDPGPVLAEDISMYHTVFLLAILGGMAVILLCLLCLLLYYCRRRCLRPRGSHHKLTLSSGLEGSKRDQATSMSHLNLISGEVQLELVSTATEPDSSTPMLRQSSYDQHDNHHHRRHHHDNHHPNNLLPTHAKHSRSSLGNSSSRHGSSLGNLTPSRRDYRQSTDTFPCKAALASVAADRGYRQSYASVCSSAHQVSDGGLLGLAAAAAANGAPPSSSPPHSPCRGVEIGVDGGRPPLDFPLSRSADHLERPPVSAAAALVSRPGQLLCCGSVDLLSGAQGGAYPRGVRPTLVIPAHYMRLPGEHPLCGQALLLQTDQQSDLETLQAEINASHPQSPGQSPPPRSADAERGDGQGPRQAQAAAGGLSGSLSIPAALGEAGLVEMNSEDALLAEKTLMELRGGKPLPHPRAWFVSLEGRSNAHIRHSYVDLQRAGCHGGGGGGGGEGRRRRGGGGGGGKGNNDASLDSGVDLNEPTATTTATRGGGRGRGSRGREADRDRDSDKGPKGTTTTPPTRAYTQLVCVDDLEGGGADQDEEAPGGEQEKAPGGEQEVGGGGGDEVLSPSSPSPSPTPTSSSSSSSSSAPASPPPLPTPEGVVAYRTEHVVVPSGSPDEDLTTQEDGEEEEEEKKSPWQRREERPLLSFNALK